MIPSSIRTGDRVRITAVCSYESPIYAGCVGTVVSSPGHRQAVLVRVGDTVVRAEAVEPVTEADTVRVGDRVIVRAVRLGSGAYNIGREGTVQRLGVRRSYFYGEPGLSITYFVKMDAPRPEQVEATRVEKITAPSLKVGDRVRVVETSPWGGGEKINGQVGVIKSLTPDTMSHRGGVQVELDTQPSPFRKDPNVGRVEKIAEPAEPLSAREKELLAAKPRLAEVGDRVVIREGFLNGTSSNFVGQEGKVVEVRERDRDGAKRTDYLVAIDGRVGNYSCRVVEKIVPTKNYPPAEAAVGDEVVILRTRDQDEHLGKVGSVIRIEAPRTTGGHTSGRTFIVLVPGVAENVRASKVVKNPTTPTPAPAATAEPAVEVLIDTKRVQAAYAAHNLLGDAADLTDLIGVAEFVLAEHRHPATTSAIVPSLDVDRALIANPVEVVDNTGDRVTFAADNAHDEDVVKVRAGGVTTYLRSADIDRLVPFLQAAQRSNAARLAA